MAEETKEKPRHLWVDGIVAVRDKLPYLQLSNENGIIAQLDMAQARQVAADILQMAARTEADAMVHKFFSAINAPPEAANMFMRQFRDFRAELDEGSPERV